MAAKVLNNIGYVQVKIGKIKQAKKSFENAMRVYRVASVDDPDNSALTLAMATTLSNNGSLYGFMDLLMD